MIPNGKGFDGEKKEGCGVKVCNCLVTSLKNCLRFVDRLIGCGGKT